MPGFTPVCTNVDVAVSMVQVCAGSTGRPGAGTMQVQVPLAPVSRYVPAGNTGSRNVVCGRMVNRTWLTFRDSCASPVSGSIVSGVTALGGSSTGACTIWKASLMTTVPLTSARPGDVALTSHVPATSPALATVPVIATVPSAALVPLNRSASAVQLVAAADASRQTVTAAPGSGLSVGTPLLVMVDDTTARIVPSGLRVIVQAVKSPDFSTRPGLGVVPAGCAHCTSAEVDVYVLGWKPGAATWIR